MPSESWFFAGSPSSLHHTQSASCVLLHFPAHLRGKKRPSNSPGGEGWGPRRRPLGRLAKTHTGVPERMLGWALPWSSRASGLGWEDSPNQMEPWGAPPPLLDPRLPLWSRCLDLGRASRGCRGGGGVAEGVLNGSGQRLLPSWPGSLTASLTPSRVCLGSFSLLGVLPERRLQLAKWPSLAIWGYSPKRYLYFSYYL